MGRGDHVIRKNAAHAGTGVSAGAASDSTCWLGRMTCETTPMLVKKDCADRVFSSEATMRNFFSAFQIFQLDPSVESVVLLCGDVLTNFLLRRAVRIYVNACQNRLQWACGIPFLWLFVLVGLAQEING